MAKLTRKSAKVFAEQASAAVGGIAQFGSLAAGDIQYSKDVDVIQALDAYKEGWASAVVGNKSPAMEDRNALDYLLSYQQAYIMQHGVPEWLSTETYYKNSYVVDSNGELRVSIGDNNTGHDPILDEGGQYWGYAGARGSGKRVGEVYFSQSKNATDNPGALPLFTGEVVSNANNIYPQFYAWVLSHTELCKTQAEYDTAISTYGECPYYVLDTTNHTIRLPKLVNYIKMANTTNGVTQSVAGLPNITGNIGNWDVQSGALGDGAFSIDQRGNYKNAGGTYQSSYAKNFHFSASYSNATYGKSNTVTPAHTTVFPWVCAYQAAIPASTAQAAEFQEALTSKADADLSNVPASVGIRKLIEVYSNGTSWYKVFAEYDPSTGDFIGNWCEQGGQVIDTGSSGTVDYLLTFKDLTYTLTTGEWGAPHIYDNNQDTGGYESSLGLSNATTSSFRYSVVTHRCITWKACGYIS